MVLPHNELQLMTTANEHMVEDSLHVWIYAIEITHDMCLLQLVGLEPERRSGK